MPKLLHVIPSKQLHRVESDLDTLRANLDEREIGFCTTDKCAYIKIGDDLFPMGHGLPNPEGLSFLIGEKIEEGEEATVRSVYGWQPAEQETFSTPQTRELVLWTKIYGKGFAADIAFMDKYGRDIAEMLDYSNVFVAEYGETTFSAIADAVAGGKIVMLKRGNTGKFTPMSTWSSGGCTFVTPVDAYGNYHSYNVALDDTWTDVPVSIGENAPTENSNKLLTSGGAYTALAEKANSTNITPGTFTKVSVNSQGVVTNGQQLDANDIPNHSADKLTEGHLHPDRLEDGSIPAEKLEIRKKLMVDGETITAVETLTAVVLNALPALQRICQGEHGVGKYWIDETTGKVMTVATGSTEPSVAYANLSSCLTELILYAAETPVQIITSTNRLSSSSVSVAAIYNWVCGNILQVGRDTQELDKPVTSAEQSQGYKDLVFVLETQLYPATSFINVVITKHHTSDVTSPPSTGTFYKGIEVYLGNEDSPALFLIRKLNTDYTALDDRGVTVDDALSSPDFAYMPMWNCTMAGFPNLTLCDRVCVRFIFEDHTTFGDEPKLSASIFATVIRDPTQFNYN